MEKKIAYIVLLIYCSFVFSALFILFFFPNQINRSEDKLISPMADKTLGNTSPSPSPIDLPKLSYENIFAKDHSWVEELPEEKITNLITTGDVIPARSVNFKMQTYNDFTHPFLKTADFLRSADITLINMEAPLTINCPVTNSGMIFCGDQRFLQGLLFAGIDVVNLANNHTLNYGVEGMSQTIDVLDKNGIVFCGFPTNHLAIKQCSHLSFGFLGWNLLEDFNEQEVLDTIKKADDEVDILIVSVHWGAEYQRIPAPWQKTMARKMIDAGTDLIAGNHPHWYQPIEIYKDRLIIYAQGNFVFDQEWSEETKTGIVGKHVFYEDRLVDSQWFPVFIEDFNQPRFMSEDEGREVMKLLEKLSDDNSSN
jgi:poly-gamma-glutamate synthesis protein (capsule biosynthesis protein)